jgi:parallel beta-helix repeat protein
MKTRYLLFAFVFIMATAPIYAGTVYCVSGVSGNDSNPGTQLAPWKTIQKAANIMIAGDEVIVAAGNYPERVTITRPGINGAIISYTATGTVECRGFTIKADYILIDGFKVTATEASWNPPAYGICLEGKYCTIENNYAYYSPRGGIQLLPASSNCVIRNNRCHRNGMVGLEVHGSNHLVENNEVWGSVVYHTPTGLNNGDADAIRYFGSGHILRGNYIHDIKYDDPENVGYDPHIDGFQTWADSYHTAASNILIEKNLIVLPVYKTAAANGHGFMLRDASYITIRNNIVITHGGTETGGNGGTCHHLSILNNTFVGRLDFLKSNWPLGISLENCPYSTVKNNVVYNQVNYALYLTSGTLTGLEISNNCIYNENGSTPGGTHYPYDLWGLDPAFGNPAARDYHLKSGSPCINSGITRPDIVDDFDGVPRPIGGAYEIGAYEYGSQSDTAPSITVQPQSQTIQSGNTAVLSVTATGTAPLSYQWYQGTSGDSSNPISGGIASGYTTPSLTQSMNYWVRVSNAFGDKDSNTAVITVTPPISPPIVTTSAVTSITSTSAAGGGSVTSDGGATVTARGVCWGLTANPAISGSHTHDGSGTGGYVSSLTGLSPNTTYHVRAYATNSSGTGYGSDVAFTTSQGITLPAVTTSAVTSITSTSAAGGGSVTSDGGATVTGRGVCWGLTANPTTSGSHTDDGSETGSFVSSLTGLSPNTTYHVRAYVTNSSGTGYGSDVAFTTDNNNMNYFKSSGSWTGAEHGTDGWYVGDFNGDGKDDIFRYVAGTSGADVFLSDGTKFMSSGSWTGAEHGTDGWYVGDFNGDGKDDIFRYVAGTSGADVFLSNGTKFVSSGSWTGAGHGTDGWYVGDFNGDGKDDIFRYVAGTSGADVFLSNGKKFVYSGSWTGAGHGTDGWYVGDFNGGGRTDIFRYVAETSGADVFLSSAKKFVSSGSWTGAEHGTDGWYVGDFNGDNKDDIFRYVAGTSGADVFLSDGTKFVSSGSWTGAGHGTDGWYVGDFNGDGKDDIFRYVAGTSGADVFLSSTLVLAPSSANIRDEALVVFDEDMMMDVQGKREGTLSPQMEDALMAPFVQRMMAGEEVSVYEIQKAYEQALGHCVRRTVVHQLMERYMK